MKVICKICGAEEESEKWIPQTKERVKKEHMCFSCLHWAEQHRLDLTERGEHGWAVINGVHYVLCPHTDLNWPRGMGGAKMRIRFFDWYETICDNLWCQGEIPSGHWRDLIPDNAEFIQKRYENNRRKSKGGVGRLQ